MKTRLSCVVAILVITSMILSACGGATQTPATQAPATQAPAATTAPTAGPRTTYDTGERYPRITIGIGADPQDLLPKGVNMGSKAVIYPNIYEYLFDLENLEYVPVLARGYTVIDDLHWQVQIYDNIYDSAGNHITADDVIYSTHYLIDSGMAFKYDIFADIQRIDDYTVEYTWTRPVTGVGDLEFPWCRTVIFSQRAFESGNFATAPVGTGPYVVTEFVSGSRVVLEARDDYWQTDASLISRRHQANVQTIEYDVIPEPSQQVIALQTGAIDYSESVPNDSLADFQPGGQFADRYNVNVAFGSFFFALSLNQSEGNPGADLNFRLAVYYAIDNEAVATATGNSLPARAFGTPHFSDYVEAWDDTPSYINTYDPARARQYLAASDYDGRELQLVGGGDEPWRTILTVIQSMLLNVGINTTIVTVSGPQQNSMTTDPTAWDIMAYGMGGGCQVCEWNRVMNNTEWGNGMAMGFISDDTLQQLFRTASAVDTHDPEHMTALYSYVLEHGYYYGIAIPTINQVYTRDIAEVVMREDEFFLPGASNYYLPE